MRRGNLPGGGHDKVTWKRSRELLTRRRDNVSLRRGGDVPQWRYWVFHLGLTWDVVGTYWWDVVDMYHWDVMVTYQWDVVGCFIWALFETSWRRTDETTMLRPLETSSRHSNKMSWIRTLRRLSSRRCWVFHSRRTCDVAGTYKETSLSRCHDVFLPGGKFCFAKAHFIWKRK